MRAVVGIQLESGELILTKDLCDEVCTLVPDAADQIRAAFDTCLERVRKATYELGPEYR